ncbi:AMP-binding protein [Candidatus Palauibacter soopunensis]|uniref:class I adenylate-forming enzyme family protein n=1 Tax=Candidatus Palauibacter soopunensis TaxID=3056739 RepID=UPI0023A1F6E9|nr:AMP-binding protein [Candidatus Palauibacter soopunensis]MDE2878344.1 AMP-binding protein [Candidatus Palauibacter soopunensis]
MNDPATPASASSFALVSGDRAWSAAEIRAAGDAVAAILEEEGVGAGAVVAHQFPLDPAGAAALAAVAPEAAPGSAPVLAPAHAGWTPHERDAFVAALQPAAALTGRGAAWPTSGWRSRALTVPGIGEIALHLRDAAGAHPGTPATARARDGLPGIGAILPTSGTEGLPRFVAHEWRSLRANAVASNERLGFGAGDRWLATLAWAHVGGLAVPLRAAAAGATVALAGPRFDAASVARALGELAVTHVSLVPAMLHGLLAVGARPPGSLRAVLLGGAATPPDLAERALSAGWPIALTYGLTEAGSQVTTATPAEVRAGDRSAGVPLTGVEVRIRPPGDAAAGGDGAPTPGHIEVRGDTLFRGYVGEPARPPGAWFATGDLGRLDERGRLEVTGRLRDRIVSGGANVDPAHVEAVLNAHPEVGEAAVIGMPDGRWGQVVVAVIAGEDPDLPARLDPWCRERLSGPRVPRRWEMLDRLPRTATGKVDRARLRANLRGG